MRYLISLILSLLLINHSHAFQANLDYCNEYATISFDFLGHHEVGKQYCCKKCCDDSITSAKKCTKNYCMNKCPGEGSDDHECYIGSLG